MVEISALLHDIGKDKGRENHSKRSYELSRKFLKKLHLPEKKKKLILKCILKHRGKFSDEDNEIEVKILQSADVLGTLFDDEWQQYSRETMSKNDLLKIYGKSMKKLNLESAKKIAKPKLKELRKKLG